MTAAARITGCGFIRDDDRLRLGHAGEAAAVAYLRRRLYAVVATNFRTRYGEIDIIARRDGIIAFVEVKARRGQGFGKPFEAVGPRKQEQLRRMALAWLAMNQADPAVRRATFRFDVIAIVIGADGRVAELSHMEDAFR